MLNWDEAGIQELVNKGNIKAKGFVPQAPGVLQKKKSNKYNNIKTTIDGIVFDSKKESEYYSELKLRVKALNIVGFCRQQSFQLTEDIKYISDFVIFHYDMRYEVIDIKGVETATFKIKKKLFKRKFGFDITIIK